MGDEDDAASWRQCCLYNANDVGDRQAGEEWPHGEVLESGWRGWELVAQSIILHVDPDQVVQSWCWEAENTGDFLGMEEVGGLIPVNPHATEVVAQQVVERVSREEGQAVWNPICLVTILVKVGFGPLAQVSDGFGTLVISSRPNAKCNAVKGVCRVLLEDERVVDAVWLAAACADLNIVWETCLFSRLAMAHASHPVPFTYPHGGVQSSRNLIILLQPWTATQYFRQPELSHSALHVPNLSLSRSWCLDPL